VPKTYNARQVAQIKLEQAHTPEPPAEPDVTPYIRPFSPAEIAALIERIVARVATGNAVHLKPDTAYLLR